MMRAYVLSLAMLLLLAFSGPALAIAVDSETLPDAVQESRARVIMNGLRCLVCQNQSIEMSNAQLAVDLRQIVRGRVAAGDSDDQVRAYVVERYGDWVLMQPPFKLATLLLWLGPAGLLLLGGGAVWAGIRQRRQVIEPTALSATEQTQVEKLTRPE